MPKIAVNLNMEQIKEAFEQLPTKQKVELVEDFEKETRKARWDALINKIRQRVKKHPISQKEITRICEEVRKERYERRLKGSN